MFIRRFANLLFGLVRRMEVVSKLENAGRTKLLEEMRQENTKFIDAEGGGGSLTDPGDDIGLG